MTEEAREAHWKLTAPKGFAALKGIPELQQLLAYTAADVVHYAVGAGEGGVPGSFPCPGVNLSDPSAQQAMLLVGHNCLHDGSSLIGQVAPGLRLCLAAEVATGLMCDSQPLPPDTPQHASALLLFLAAALRQAEQECVPAWNWPKRSLWVLNPTLDCLSTLIDFFAVVDPAIINLTAMWSQPGQQQQPAAAAAAAAVGFQGDGNSSSSSGGGGGGDDSSGQRTLHLFVEEPWEVLDLTAPYSPVHDAFRIAVWVGAPGSVWQQQQQQPLAADGGGSQQQQQQQLAGLPGTPVPLSIDAVVQYILSAIDGYLDSAMPQQQQQQQSDALSSCNSSSSSSTGSDSGSNGSREADTVNATKRLLLCGRVVSKWAGALAVKLYFEAVSQVEGIRNGSWASDQPPAPQDTAAAAAEGGDGGEGVAGSEGKGGPAMLRQWLQQAAAVQAALLLTEIEGLYYGTMDILVQAVTQWEQQLQQEQQHKGEQQQQQSNQHLSGRQQQQQQQQQQQNGQQGEDHQQQQQNEREEREGLTGELYKNGARAQIIERVLLLIELARAFGDAVSDTLHTTAASRTHCCHGTSQQQQQQQQDHKHAQQPGTTAGSAAAAAADLASARSILEGLRGSSRFFSEAFQLLGEQQMSPLCLNPELWLQKQQQQQQQQQEADGDAEAPEGMNGEAAVAATAMVRQLAAQWFRTVEAYWVAGGGSSSSSSSSSNASDAASGDSGSSDGAAAAAAPVGGMPVDQVERLASTPAIRKLISCILPLLNWQQSWAIRTGMRTTERTRLDDARAAAMDDEGRQHAAERAKGGKKTAGAKGQGQQQQQQVQGDGAASSNSSSSSSSSSSAEGPAWGRLLPCWLCQQEEAEKAGRAEDSSCSSSGGGGASAGLYGRFPVPWSDPFMMRRLLWDLLGRFKTTAQQWFKAHLCVCPHTTHEVIWAMVTMSIARHLWAPPGPWRASSVSETALLLPLHVRRSMEGHLFDGFARERSEFVHGLNLGFAQQGSQATSAALLSLHALLALDPHGARVQPVPELLYYTPAGFHTSVCKTFMQAMQPMVPAACQSSLPGRQQQQQQQMYGGSQQQQQLWSRVPFPAWYVWWHLGLLAYHQQQQQQQQRHQQQQMHHDRQPVRLGMGLQDDASGSSSSSSSSVMCDMYNDPDARLFAVGYAARRLSCFDQLQLLLCNPPLPLGLQLPADVWLSQLVHSFRCRTCGNTSSIGKGPMPPCITCGSPLCSSCHCEHCKETKTCSGSSATTLEASAHHKWRILDLLKPSTITTSSTSSSRTPDLPKATSTNSISSRASTTTAAAAAAAAAVTPCIPAALQAGFKLAVEALHESQRQQQLQHTHDFLAGTLAPALAAQNRALEAAIGLRQQQLLQAVAQVRNLPPGPLQQRQLQVLMGQLQQEDQQRQQLLAATDAKPQQALLMALVPAPAWGPAGSKAQTKEVAAVLQGMMRDVAENLSVQPQDFLKQMDPGAYKALADRARAHYKERALHFRQQQQRNNNNNNNNSSSSSSSSDAPRSSSGAGWGSAGVGEVDWEALGELSDAELHALIVSDYMC